MKYTDIMKTRRSRYDITNTSPITNAQIKELLADAITYTPSAFHAQGSRVVLLLGEQHLKLWDIVKMTLKRIVPEVAFASTEKKINSFANGYGTILYFEDMETIDTLQKDFPLYAENFPIFSQQSSGMLQYSIWTALSQAGLGASLQHYNPLIDEEVCKTFKLSEKWKLIAQMPFGAPNSEPNDLTYKAIEERLIILGDLNDSDR